MSAMLWSSDTDPSWSAEDTDEEDLEIKELFALEALRFQKNWYVIQLLSARIYFTRGILQVKDAIEFYRSSEKGARSLSCMTNRFRFITSDYHIKKLRKIEKSQEIRADRVTRLRALASRLKPELSIASKFELGIALHDTGIRAIALQINRDEMCTENFKASNRWIQEFKKRCGIVSRRVITFVSRRNFMNSDRLASQAEAFVTAVRRELSGWPVVCNTDQSGFFKELHSARTLAMKGSEKSQE
ncbi:unnamed protein product [Cylicostephanus goldi]|uniref:HTH CENPB-type domain-containing protein n=1 Tax=Cylicostephanus goldi TaxID=71465 RepID=A0A3P6SY25_CYLGO|nr:unnamed protein product [Cylicostephanus goldi]